MTAQWSDDAHHAVHALLTGERQGYYVDFGPPEVLRTVWREAFWHAGRFSTFRGQDWGRRINPAHVSGHRFVVFSQNHDQVGNRATGDRPSTALRDGELAIAAALVLTSPFTPMLFMGEEWGTTTPFRYFTDHGEPELAQAVTEGRRREFAEHGWDAEDVPDPQDPATRDCSVLDHDERHRPRHAELLEWYRQLIRLRRADPDLHDGDLTATDVTWAPPNGGHPGPDADTRPEWLVVHRGALRVVCVLTPQEVTVPLHGPATALAGFGALDVRAEDGGPAAVTGTGPGVLLARIEI